LLKFNYDIINGSSTCFATAKQVLVVEDWKLKIKLDNEPLSPQTPNLPNANNNYVRK
jgi:hypothetical protein